MNELYIYDEIGPAYWGLISGKAVADELSRMNGEDVMVRINSPGGDVHEGVAIYNALNRYPGKVTVAIDALAASAASFVAMAGDEIGIAENAFLMIHNAWTIAVGNADDMRAAAATLDMHDSMIADTYVARAKITRDDVVDLMSAETWMTAAEAVEKGFADGISDALKVSACVRDGIFSNAPKFHKRVARTSRQKSLLSAEREAIRIRLKRRRDGV